MMSCESLKFRRRAFGYSGHSVFEWAESLEEFERSVYRGDLFEFSIAEFSLHQMFLKKLRAMNILDFQRSERTTQAFVDDVVLPYLEIAEGTSFERQLEFASYLRVHWNVDKAALDSCEAAFVSLKWLMKKQSNLQLDYLLHQGFDYVEMFYDLYWLELPSEFSGVLVRPAFNARSLYERYMSERSPWLKFLKGYLIVDLVDGRDLDMSEGDLFAVKKMVQENADALSHWTGRTMRS